MISYPCNDQAPMPPLSDEAAVTVLEFLHHFTECFESQYYGAGRSIGITKNDHRPILRPLSCHLPTIRCSEKLNNPVPCRPFTK